VRFLNVELDLRDLLVNQLECDLLQSPTGIFFGCHALKLTIGELRMDNVVGERPQESVIKQSALVDLYRSRRATLVEDGNRLLPAHFGDPMVEYDAVRNHVGIFDLGQRSLLRLIGLDRMAFLNSLISNDLNVLSAGQGLHAAFLDLRGNILADARIFCSTDSHIVDIPEFRKETILRYLQHRLAVEAVKIEDLSEDYTMLSIQGPHAAPLLHAFTSTNDLPSDDLAHLQVTIADIPVVLIAVTHGAELGYDLVTSVTKLLDIVRHIEEVGKRWFLSWVGIEAQEMLRIEAGIPVYGTDISEQNSIVESGQDRWISFNRHFAGFILESKEPVETGAAAIHDGEREIGTLTSCRFSPHLGVAVALGHIRRDYLTPGTRVIIVDGNKSILATVSTLPIE
jgi:aminomethyltransferase